MILAPLPIQKFFDNAGLPADRYRLFTYAAGGVTKIDTYPDASGASLNANPIVLDFRGEAHVWLDPTLAYKFVFAPPGVDDPPTSSIWTVDQIESGLTISEITQQFIGQILFPRTQAEINALIIPTDFSIPSHLACGIAWITRYGGAAGAADNTAAMNAAALVLAQTAGGGTIGIPYKGEWRMNWVCTQDNLTLYMPCGGRGEYNENCIRPFSLASAPITIGNGVTIVRYFRMVGAHVSGVAVAGQGAAGVTQSAFNAPQCVRIYGATAVHFNDCVLYNGLVTFDAQPSATIPTFDIRLLDCKVRNDLTDSNNAACFNFVSLNNTGFLRDVNLIGCKVEGPDLGYAYKLDGTLNGFSIMLIGGYTDHVGGHGVYLAGAAAIRSWGQDLDAGANGVVIVTTDGTLTDPTRVLFGYITQAGQRIQFNGTALDSGTLQAGAASTATLRAAASFADNALTGHVLRILTGTGAGQERQIASNVGATDVVTLTSAWATIPNSASTYSIATTVLLLSESDHFLYRARINAAFFGQVNYFTVPTDPYNLSMTLEVLSSTGPVNFAGTSLGIATAGHGLRIATGANAKIGSSVLVAGTVVVANTSVTANSNIQLTRSTTGGTAGHLSYTKINGTSFTINSSSGTDTSTVNWIITEQT